MLLVRAFARGRLVGETENNHYCYYDTGMTYVKSDIIYFSGLTEYYRHVKTLDQECGHSKKYSDSKHKP